MYSHTMRPGCCAAIETKSAEFPALFASLDFLKISFKVSWSLAFTIKSTQTKKGEHNDTQHFDDARPV